MAILNLLSFLVFVAFMVTGVLWVLFKALGSLGNPVSDKAVNGIVQKLRASLQKARESLIPWERDTLPLLSLNKTDVRKPGWSGKPASATMTTIYQEPVLNYAVHKSGKNTVVLIQTSDREIVLRKTPKQTDIWVNGQPLGVFINGKLLAPGSQSDLLAQLQLKKEEEQSALILESQTAATLTNPNKKTGPNPRALTLLKPELKRQEEDIVLALGALQWVGQ